MEQEINSPFVSASYKANPYAFYEQMRKESPVTKTVLASGVEVYLVTYYEDVLTWLKDPRLVKNIRNARHQSLLAKLIPDFTSTTMLKADPPQHTRIRSLANEAFKPKYINQLRGRIEEITSHLLDEIQPAGKMDLISDFALPLPITVISEMFGVPVSDNKKFSKWSTDLITSGILSSEKPKFGGEVMQLANYIRKLINQHRKTPKDDIISQLINAEQNGDHLNSVELLTTIIMLLIAGHETTVHLIGNGMLALLQNPDQLEKLKQDPTLIKPAVEELLRYANPVQLVNRYAAEDIEIGGQKIPRGSHLLMGIASANRDPGHFTDPDKLDITREEARHMAFSQGIHYCLGAPLARLEGEIAFTALLSRLPNIRLNIATEDLRWRPTLELYGLQSLPVIF